MGGQPALAQRPGRNVRRIPWWLHAVRCSGCLAACPQNHYPSLYILGSLPHVLPGGAFSLGPAVSWVLLAGAHIAIEHQTEPVLKASLRNDLVAQVDGISRGETFRRLPLSELPLIGQPPEHGGLMNFFRGCVASLPTKFILDRTVMSAGACPPFWRLVRPLPGYHSTRFQRHSPALRSLAGQPAKAHHIIGPWIHVNYNASAREVDFSLRASWMFVLPEETQLRWFDYWLKSLPNGMLGEPPCQIFVIGADRWRDETSSL